MELFIATFLKIFLGYVAGSIPFGLILSKVFLKKDIREIGSGNIGATNVLRTGNKLIAFLTLLLDAGKGAFLILISTYVSIKYYSHADFIPTIESLAKSNLMLGLGAILGHCFPVWLKFKGGKGVSTAFGVLLAAVPYAGLVSGLVWVSVVILSRISSLGALCAAAIAPVATYFIYGAAPSIIVVLIALLIFVRHKDNIMRLLKGTEPKIGKGKKNQDKGDEDASAHSGE